MWLKLQGLLLPTPIQQKSRPIKTMLGCTCPLYSPDLAQWDSWLLPKVKVTMKGKHFNWEYCGSHNGTAKETQKENARPASEHSQGEGTSVFKVRRILKGIHGNGSFTIKVIFNLSTYIDFITTHTSHHPTKSLKIILTVEPWTVASEEKLSTHTRLDQLSTDTKSIFSQRH